jgi:voltage-gated potassium channel
VSLFAAKNRIPLRLMLIGLYFGVWAGCGHLYRKEANRSGGTSFIFQEDVRVTDQIAAFKTATGSNGPDRLLRNIIHKMSKEEDYGWWCGNTFPQDPIYPHFPCNGLVKPEWANYYTESFEAEGLTHFVATVEKHESGPEFRRMRFQRIEDADAASCCYRMRLELYTLPQNATKPIPLSVYANTRPVKSYPIWTYAEPKFYPSLPSPLVDISALPDLLEQSFNMLDDSDHIMRGIVRGDRSYRLLDFLYFSAVTITTLGYGDILPNSSYVRLLVMTEALLGIIIIAAFVSSLFSSGHPGAPGSAVNQSPPSVAAKRR